MALKITNKKIISIFLFLLTYLFFISLKVISAESINVATSVDIGNAKPQIENIFISSTPSSLKDDYYQNITSPNTGNTTKIYINGKTTDNNGAIDIDTVKAVFYTSDAVNSYDCQENTQDCYRSNCSISSSSDISLIYNCEINLACSAKQTVKEPNQNENWKVRLAVKDKASDTSFDDSKSIEMNPFPEIADGIDNNCNGLIDEGIETANNITGVNPLFLQLINNQQNKINKPIEIAITPKPPVVKLPTEPITITTQTETPGTNPE
ncbi:MAG: hypothetical protein NT091_04545, partial [Candidatus Falkowbacteria bacterium]|nr:hypothetical protein [Candidatus Falkowbacteria bacterium]